MTERVALAKLKQASGNLDEARKKVEKVFDTWEHLNVFNHENTLFLAGARAQLSIQLVNDVLNWLETRNENGYVNDELKSLDDPS